MVKATSTSSSVKPRLTARARCVVTRPVSASTVITYAAAPAASSRKRRRWTCPGAGTVTPRRSARLGLDAQERGERRGASRAGLAVAAPARRSSSPCASRIDDHLVRLLARDRLLARRAQEGREAGHLGPRPHLVGGAPDRGDRQRGGQRRGRASDDHQLERG